MAHEPSKSKSKSQKQKENDKILKKIHKTHPEFELTYDMMLGIRQAVSTSEMSIASQTPREVGADDDDSSDDENSQLESEFMTSIRYRFPAAGSTNPPTPAHIMRDFKFKDYCPQIFKQLREWFGISQAEYLVALCGDFAFLEFISNSKSGQFFFFSHNQQYMIKTMTKSESLLLRKILPAYFRYVSRQPNTMLTKFFGMHRVKPHKRNAIYFLIMSNVFFSDVDIHVQYDLKGSTFGRRTSEEEKQRGCILKDLDFVDDGQEIIVGPKRARLFHEQLRKDCEFLRKLKIMDYSLLVGIHYRDRAQAATAPSPLHQIREDEDAATGSSVGIDDITSESMERDDGDDDDHHEDDDDHVDDGKEREEENVGLSAPPVAAPPHPIETDLLSPRFKSGSSTRSLGYPASPRSPPRLSTRRSSGFKPTYVTQRPSEFGFSVPDLLTPSMRAEARPSQQYLERQTSTWIRTDINEHENPFTTEHGGMCFEDDSGNKGNEIYFTGVIDILQKYNKRKKVENFFKSLSHDPNAISAVPPEIYARRLCDFMRDKVV